MTSKFGTTKFGTTKFGSMIKVGAVAATLALVGTACGGDGGGGIDKKAARAQLEAIIGGSGMPAEMIDCFVDAALETFDAADLESVIAGGDPSQKAEDAFTKKAQKCGG